MRSLVETALRVRAYYSQLATETACRGVEDVEEEQ
jgi:hypothetical protein